MSAAFFSTPAIAVWISYTAIISCMAVLAAIAGHDAQRASHRPLRWIWIASIGIITALSIAAPFRNRVATSVDVPALESVEGAPLDVSVAAENNLLTLISSVRDLAIAPLQIMLERAKTLISSGPVFGYQVLALLWLAASAAIIAGFLVSYKRMMRHVRKSRRAEIGGVVVLISPTIGPAVVGLLPSQIVVPEWLCSRPVHEQQIAVTHETEHVRAADPWMLVAACAAVALMPWNPALWYCLSRLRLAIEIDCERRVLRRGVSVNNYGSLLIDLSTSHSRLPMPMPAFPDSHSHLERRLIAMTEQTVSTRSARRIAGSILAATLLITACESRLPTSADLEQMDVTSAERQAAAAGVLKATEARYVVDGKTVDALEAKKLKAAEIGSIGFIKADKSMPDEIRISTFTGAPFGLAPTMSDQTKERIAIRAASKSAFAGLVVIDGVVAGASTLKGLSPDRIASMEVLKGAAATRKYSDPRAANGVIVVTTKQ